MQFNIGEEYAGCRPGAHSFYQLAGSLQNFNIGNAIAVGKGAIIGGKNVSFQPDGVVDIIISPVLVNKDLFTGMVAVHGVCPGNILLQRFELAEGSEANKNAGYRKTEPLQKFFIHIDGTIFSETSVKILYEHG